jgi:ribonucleoside-diphosphate reductase alpha chain
VIDKTKYPVDGAAVSNTRNRPIGIGVQGLADVYAILGLEFGAGSLNHDIFETIYYAAVSESVKLARICGRYETFDGSPASYGIFQFDLWGFTATNRYDWESLRDDMIKFGMRNSLLVAPMPTASTSQILGFNECFEPFTTNLYLRRTIAGEFIVINKYLVQDLMKDGLWSPSVRESIIRDSGSIQNIPEIPDHLKNVYKTAWEISSKKIIDMAAERGPFICQSQSMNLFMADPTNAKLSSMHMYAWKQGLKTGMYYLRTKAKARAIQFTLAPTKEVRQEECLMCSS